MLEDQLEQLEPHRDQVDLADRSRVEDVNIHRGTQAVTPR